MRKLLILSATLLCRTPLMAGEIPGLSANLPPFVDSRFVLNFSNDFLGRGGGTDDYRTQQFIFAADFGQHWIASVDHSVLTSKDPVTPGRIDQVSGSVGYRFLDNRRDGSVMRLSGGLGFRSVGNFGGERMQNGFHRLIDSGVDVLPYSPVDETYLTAWVDADRYRLWKEAGDWRFGYWLNARALVTSDGQLDSAVSALGVASRRMLDIWAGLRHDWRSGYDEAVQRATAAEEQDLALVLGVRFGSLVLETVQQFDNASSYGQLRLMSLESAAGGRASAAPRLGLELGFLLPDVHLHLAGRVRSQLLVRDASVWNETVVVSLDYGEPQYGDDPSAFIESTQIGIGFEWQRPVSDRSNWLSGYVSVAAGWRRERLIGDGLLSGQASAAVDRGVLIVGTGLRFHASTMGQRWRYRIQTGLSAWLPASDAIVTVSQQVFSIQEPAVGVSLGVSFEFQ